MKDPTGHSARILTASSRGRWGWYQDDCSVAWSTKARLTIPPLGEDFFDFTEVVDVELLLLLWLLLLLLQLLLTHSDGFDDIWLSLHLLQLMLLLSLARLLTIFLSGWCPEDVNLSSHIWLFSNKLFFTCNNRKMSDIFFLDHDNKNKISWPKVWWCPNIFAPGYIQGLKIIDQSVLATLHRPWELARKNYEWALPAATRLVGQKRKWMKNVFDRFECDAYWALSGHFVRHSGGLASQQMKVLGCYFLWTDSLHDVSDGMDLTILGITRAEAWKPSRIVKRSCQ